MTDWKLFLAILIPVIGAISTLVGIIWNMHSKRVDAIETRTDGITEKLFKKLDEIKDLLGAWQLISSKEFQTKTDCEKLRHDCKGGKS